MIAIEPARVAAEGALASDPTWNRVEVRRLASAERTGARRGALAELVVPPGEGYGVHRRSDCERAIYLCEGRGEHTGAGAARALAREDALYVPPGAWHGFRNTGSEPARLLELCSPAPVDAAEPWTAGGEDGPAVRHVAGAQVGDDPAMGRRRGLPGLHIRWLVTRETVGARALLLGASRFEAGGEHNLHRHPGAEEILMIVAGGGRQLAENDETSVGAGEAVFIEQAEWHGFRAPVETRCLFMYLGAASLDQAGHELREAAG